MLDDDKCYGEKHKNNERYKECKDRLGDGVVREELIGKLIFEPIPEGGEETNMKSQICTIRSFSTFTGQYKIGFFWLMFQTWIVRF